MVRRLREGGASIEVDLHRLFDERLPPEPEYPADKPSRGDRTKRDNLDRKKTSTNGILKSNSLLQVLSAPFMRSTDVKLLVREYSPCEFVY